MYFENLNWKPEKQPETRTARKRVDLGGEAEKYNSILTQEIMEVVIYDLVSRYCQLLE